MKHLFLNNRLFRIWKKVAEVSDFFGPIFEHLFLIFEKLGFKSKNVAPQCTNYLGFFVAVLLKT